MLIDVTPCGRARKLAAGIYQSSWWNFELDFRGHQDYRLDYPDLPLDFPCYGVCDSPEQLQSLLPAELLTNETPYVISMAPILRSEQEPGGWRWHKWGPYLGVQHPTTEYLHDEPLIEQVWTFHVYQVR